MGDFIPDDGDKGDQFDSFAAKEINEKPGTSNPGNHSNWNLWHGHNKKADVGGNIFSGKGSQFSGSYGGYAALMGAATSNLYKCSVSFAGVTDLLYLLDESRRYGGEETLRIMLGDKSRAELKETSPVNLADQIEIPVLLVQGDDDSRVLLKHGQSMRDALEEARVEHIYIEQEDSDHFLTLKRNRLEFFKETEKFLEKYIGS